MGGGEAYQVDILTFLLQPPSSYTRHLLTRIDGTDPPPCILALLRLLLLHRRLLLLSLPPFLLQPKTHPCAFAAAASTADAFAIA